MFKRCMMVVGFCLVSCLLGIMATRNYYSNSLVIQNNRAFNCYKALQGCEVTAGTVESELEETRYDLNKCDAFVDAMCSSHQSLCVDTALGQ